MADFLASFNFREEEPELDSRLCTGLEELQLQFRDALDGKVTATRAERVATRLDLAASAELTLGVSASENNVLEGLGALDPSLGGALPTDASVGADGGQVARVVLVNEAVMNQSSDEPVLQTAVAKHIAGGVGQVDGSEWALRDSSRGANGWIFTFICKGSMEHWQRQNKSQPKTLVAEYSHRELDPLLGSRPAFDCRGVITISFFRKSRTVSIEYDHLPLHRTVAELSALYQPLIPRRPLLAAEKKAKAPRQPGAQRKKRDGDNATNGEGKKPRKRKRKTDDAGASEEQGVTEIDPSLPTQIQTFTNQVGGDENGGQQQSQADQSAQNSAAGQLVINVTPEEAERRRNVAVAMLQQAAVDPESLSPEQFNIFANQSPDLQKESLNMLIRYGAERLRIVHPSSKEGSAQPPSRDSSSAPAVQSNVQEDPSGPVTTSGLALQTATPTTTKKSRKKKQTASNGDDGTTGEATTNGEAKKTRRRGPAKSRTSCAQCKQRRVKCPKETPICSECREAGLICEFAPPKPKKPKSNALITIEDEAEEDELEETLGEGQDDEPQLEGQQQSHGDDDDAEGFPDIGDEHVHTQMPIGDVLPNNVHVTDWEASHNQTSYFPPTATMAVSEAGTSQPPHTAGVPISDLVNLIMPSGRPYYSNMPAADMQEQTLAHQRKSSTQSSARHGPGRNMTARPAQDEEHHGSVNPQSLSEWSGDDSPVTQAAAVVAQAVTSMQDQDPHEPVYGLSEPPANRGSGWRSANAQQPSMGVSQKQGVSPAALQRPGTASPRNEIQRTSLPKGKQPSKRGAVQNSPSTDQQPNSRRSGLQKQVGMAGSAAYNSYDRYSSTRGAETASTDRISYEPYQYQRDAVGTAPYSGYGHSQLATTSAASIPAQTANTEIPAADRPGAQTFGPYTSSAQRNQSHNQSASYLGLRANAQAQEFNNSGSESSHDSRQVFHMRSQSGASRQGQAGMKQDRNYMTYPSHIQQQQQTPHQRAPQQHAQHTQHAQQSNQHQNWYNFNNPPNASYASTTGGHGSGYSWNLPGDS
ncbi:hypothetical protein TRIATDRAFT_33176 [Trichoderma atroviride IMI 206040]|uniref:Zn(2)-C6 fungal-type domain-containing protein n=1 Tax=Hypocrea atroviridis (strain ATCC 20476 / IMI 206040) TaxID=452589 RepID=G9P2M1_HYPAI|nr:uncharacterized protein TRIATDRAFT_33176 [Trichoderma atroviride IMI 206040]EHK43539.1 hypothetical protein TRIATDRAFT_33176 [Trichoderma atroviride IMI 206040]